MNVKEYILSFVEMLLYKLKPVILYGLSLARFISSLCESNLLNVPFSKLKNEFVYIQRVNNIDWYL